MMEKTQTNPTFKLPVIRRCTSSIFKADGRQRTTTPLSIWLEASLSAPRRTMTSFSSLQGVSSDSISAIGEEYRISKRVALPLPVTPEKKLGILEEYGIQVADF